MSSSHLSKSAWPLVSRPGMFLKSNGKDIENGKLENKELKYGGHVLVHRSVTDIS